MDDTRKNTLETLRKIHGDNALGVTKECPVSPYDVGIIPCIVRGVMLGVSVGLTIGMVYLMGVQFP